MRTHGFILAALTLAACVAAGRAEAAIITFDTVIAGQTSFGFDGDGDTVNDVIFSTTDPSGFNVVGPGTNQNFIQEPGLEGTSTLNPDLRVDFLNGASGSISFGFALNSTDEVFATTSFNLFDAADNLLAAATEPGFFTITGNGISDFPEGEVHVTFSGIAAYGLFDFESEFGRYIIDNFEGTFGGTETVPEPAAAPLLGLGLLAVNAVLCRPRRTASSCPRSAARRGGS
jgi:hypothetical protein